ASTAGDGPAAETKTESTPGPKSFTNSSAALSSPKSSDPDTPIPIGRQALYFNDNYILRTAATLGDFALIRLCVARKCNVHANNDESISEAIKHKHKEIADYLIKHGATPTLAERGELEYAKAQELSWVQNALDTKFGIAFGINVGTSTLSTAKGNSAGGGASGSPGGGTAGGRRRNHHWGNRGRSPSPHPMGELAARLAMSPKSQPVPLSFSVDGSGGETGSSESGQGITFAFGPTIDAFSSGNLGGLGVMFEGGRSVEEGQGPGLGFSLAVGSVASSSLSSSSTSGSSLVPNGFGHESSEAGTTNTSSESTARTTNESTDPHTAQSPPASSSSAPSTSSPTPSAPLSIPGRRSRGKARITGASPSSFKSTSDSDMNFTFSPPKGVDFFFGPSTSLGSTSASAADLGSPVMSFGFDMGSGSGSGTTTEALVDGVGEMMTTATTPTTDRSEAGDGNALRDASTVPPDQMEQTPSTPPALFLEPPPDEPMSPRMRLL
ncbi:hypothetical protein HK102_003222, partial [Quaeritorhiza haematococci]